MLGRMTVTTCRPSAEHPGGNSKALPEEASGILTLKSIMAADIAVKLRCVNILSYLKETLWQPVIQS